MPLTFFCLAISIGYLVFLLNYTDFVAEYGKLANRYLKLDEYQKWKEGGGFGYPVFIREKYNTFWGRMFGCPYCLISFSSMVLHTIFTSTLLFLVGSFVSVAIWGLLTLMHRQINKNDD